MTFSDIVEKVKDGDKRLGFLAVSAFDGLIIEEWKRDDIDMDISAIAAETALLIKECRRISDDNGLSVIDEITLRGEDCIFHVISVGEDYFVIVMTAETNLSGKSRFYIKSVIPGLKKVL